jgi:predicted enzyme related to lactoylglutathione lyase
VICIDEIIIENVNISNNIDFKLENPMSAHNKINYLEIPAKDLSRTKIFFTRVFGWSFVDYGPEYTSFSQSGMAGGFYKSDRFVATENGAALIVVYSGDIEKKQLEISNAGGEIIKPLFSFPGGHRFHFTDPNGNEYAVWTDKYQAK